MGIEKACYGFQWCGFSEMYIIFQMLMLLIGIYAIMSVMFSISSLCIKNASLLFTGLT